MIYSNSFGQVFRITTLATVFFFLSLVPRAMGNEAKTIRVLFLGNSLTTANNLPQLIADLAKSRNHIMEYDVYAPGGKTFAQHTSDPVALSKIKKTGWDFVVLQEQSQAPSFSQEQVQQEVYPFASELSRFIKEANPGAHVVFYMTMARREGDPHNAIQIPLPELETYEGMQNRINQGYLTMATENNALIAPVGLVWKKVRERYPSIDLYADEIHPNLTGAYLAACVFYSVFFNDTSAGLAHPSVIDSQTALAIQNITDEVSKLPDLSREIVTQKFSDVSTESEPNIADDIKTTSPPDGQSDALFRVGSEVIYRKDLKPPQADIEKYTQKFTPAEFDNWYKSYQNDMALSLLSKKLQDVFCEHADCIPEERYVQEWKIFIEEQINRVGISDERKKAADEESLRPLEAILGGPPSHWQTNKALYEHYGGRVLLRNLGYYEPIEAWLRLFHEMREKSELDIYDFRVRDDFMQYFKYGLPDAIEVDRKFQKEKGMRDPWEYPFWGKEAKEAMGQKIKAAYEKWQTTNPKERP